MKTLKNIEKNTSAYEICLKSVPDSSCSCSFCFQKNCEDSWRTRSAGVFKTLILRYFSKVYVLVLSIVDSGYAKKHP